MGHIFQALDLVKHFLKNALHLLNGMEKNANHLGHNALAKPFIVMEDVNLILHAKMAMYGIMFILNVSAHQDLLVMEFHVSNVLMEKLGILHKDVYALKVLLILVLHVNL